MGELSEAGQPVANTGEVEKAAKLAQLKAEVARFVEDKITGPLVMFIAGKLGITADLDKIARPAVEGVLKNTLGTPIGENTNVAPKTNQPTSG